MSTKVRRRTKRHLVIDDPDAGRKLMESMVKEKNFTTQVLAYARQCGWLAGHFHDSRRDVGDGKMVGDADATGVPDTILIHPGRGQIILAELKTVKGVVKPAQQEWLDAAKACGAGGYVWRPTKEGWAEIEQLLTFGRMGA